ncbi:MAG: lysine--tRNA ligase [SAR202 cluster bacterium]|nr:lysine--tRNA ligase [SAR202 cluster bacterium]
MQEFENPIPDARLNKLKQLRGKGIDPYPNHYSRTHNSSEATSFYEDLESSLDENGRTPEISVAGRITAMRGMGKATFIDIMDSHGHLQSLARQSSLSSYAELRDIDIGDWIGMSGPLLKTRTGQVTLEIKSWSVLSKSLRPLPEKWHGLSDVEIRYRQRYLDLIANEDARNVAVLRSKFVSELRKFMQDQNFIEVETPILVPIATGGTARPFITHYNALGRDLYLRIATELYLKRLMVGGLERVFEIGRIFRNEGLDLHHNPEFTMMESYEAYSNYYDVMEFVENLIHTLAQTVLGTPEIKYGGHDIDLTPPWTRLDLRKEIKSKTGIDFLKSNDVESLSQAMESIGINVDKQVSWGGMIDKLISSAIEPYLTQPVFLVDYPVEMSPLAKAKQEDPRLAERFEGFIAGMEICNAFTELNDPIDQRTRLEKQEELRIQFQDEDMDRLDEDFLTALEYGMPPTGGLGLGIDRLVMLFSGKTSIKEVVLFPQLRNQ